MNLLTKLFGSYSKKELKRIEPLKQAVLALDDKYTKMTDEELKGQTAVLKERLSLGSSLDDILPEAFATCREAMWRVLSIKPFPVQIIGGIILHQGRIAEMKTGEGKTFTAALPAYLNALSGKGVHIVTVNDYLAKYQGEMMARVFNYLGLTVGLAIPGMEPDEKKKAYACDITYATNNEIGFDYLRDNMVTYKERKVQRGHNFAIVDEVDSILIDEARTPLIISGQGEQSTELYNVADRFAKTLRPIRVAETKSGCFFTYSSYPFRTSFINFLISSLDNENLISLNTLFKSNSGIPTLFIRVLKLLKSTFIFDWSILTADFIAFASTSNNEFMSKELLLFPSSKLFPVKTFIFGFSSCAFTISLLAAFSIM